MDLVARLVVVPEAVGREDVLSATRALRWLLAATADCYPHIDHAYGFSVQTAAAVACTMGRCNDALMLLAWQSSPPAAPAVRRRHCHRARLPPAMQSEGAGHVVQQTHQRGITMSLEQLVELATDIARNPPRVDPARRSRPARNGRGWS